MAGSTGYNSRAYVSNAPGAFAYISATDFGATPPAAPVVTPSVTSGSLATTAFTQVVWITKEGVSLPSAEVSTPLTGDTSASVAQPPVPSNGAQVIGWVILEGATTGSERSLVAGQAVQPFALFNTAHGRVIGFPISTTTVVVLHVGTGMVAPTIDSSGIQPALPVIPASSTFDYKAIVPNAGSQWKVQKTVQYMRSDGTTETAGITLGKVDCIQPVYPGTGTVVAAGTFMEMNGYLFAAVIGGTTAVKFIGFSNFNTVAQALTVDGSVTWVSYGKAALLRMRFANVGLAPATPTAQTYEFFQF